MIAAKGRRRGHGLRKSDARGDVLWMLDQKPIDLPALAIEADNARGDCPSTPKVFWTLAVLTIATFVAFCTIVIALGMP